MNPYTKTTNLMYNAHKNGKASIQLNNTSSDDIQTIVGVIALHESFDMILNYINDIRTLTIT